MAESTDTRAIYGTQYLNDSSRALLRQFLDASEGRKVADVQEAITCLSQILTTVSVVSFPRPLREVHSGEDHFLAF